MRYCVFFIVAYFVTGLGSVLSQEVSILSQALELEKNTIEALALYPQKERMAILEAATRPQVLVHMQHIRGKTEQRFRELLENHPQEVQSDLFNLSRYQELIAGIVHDGRKKSAEDMIRLLDGYPEDVAMQAKNANTAYFPDLLAIHSLFTEADMAFQVLIEPYPASIQNAYAVLLDMPDVTAIMITNMALTVLLGDIYQRYPEQLMAELDELGLKVAEQNMKDLQEWKQYLIENPEALSEYQDVTREFVQSQGYDDQYYEFEEKTDQFTEPRVVVHHVYRPYPYWFGLPWWHTYDTWYPYPWWYYSGYYYGPGNVIVFINMPSPYFFNWYMYRYHHFYHYPHFTNHIFAYYYGPRRGTVVHTTIGGWLKEHQDEIPERWLADQSTRTKRIEEFGKFKSEFEAVVRENNGRPISKSDYIRQNAERFPELSEVVREDVDSRTTPIKENDRPTRTPEQTAPATRTPQPVPDKPATPEIKPEQDRRFIPQTPAPRSLDRAKEHHQQTWERTNPQPPRIRTPQTTPPTRQQIPSTPERKPSEPRRGGG